MANLIRRDPFYELTSLPDRMNQLLNQALGGFEGLGNPGRGVEHPLTSSSFMPPVDIFEDEHDITLQAEVPGIEEKDLELTLENNVLTISGERRLENEENKENFHRIERRYGRFTRSFTLPSTVDPESVHAIFENGILKIVVAKREEAKPKQIKITPGKLPTTGLKPGKEKAA